MVRGAGGEVVRGLLLAVLFFSFMLPGAVHTQAQEITGHFDVFVETDPATGAARIYFMDALSGLSNVVNVDQGRNFTLVGDYVLYEKPSNGVIMRATVYGLLEPHPFIRRSVGIESIRWVTSPDAKAIAWVEVARDGTSAAYVAWADGRDLRQLPIESPAPPLQLAPVALSNGMARFFYDMAYDPTASAPFAVYQHVRAYHILDEQFAEVPQEPNCPCAAAAAPDGRLFARLEAEGGRGPFAVHIWDLPSGADIHIPAPDLAFPLAGDLLLNATATRAVYSAAAGVGDQPNTAQEQYALVLVDAVAGQQTVLVAPGALRYRPVAFIDGDEALLLTGVNGPGTYKLDLASRALKLVADDTYLGAVSLS